MIWGWVLLISTLVVGIVFVAVIIDRITMEDLDRYNREMDRKIREAELGRLAQLPTKSRIRNKPDL